MCLAVPGKILSIVNEDPLMRVGRVSFGGVVKEVNLAFVPEACVGDYVVVHVGFALSRIDAAEAQKVFDILQSLEDGDENVSLPAPPRNPVDQAQGGKP
jgi:hydrogenase expression/formation protein HypC